MNASSVTEQELVVHVFAPLDGPRAGEFQKCIRRLWSRCQHILRMTETIPRVQLPKILPEDFSTPQPSSALAAQQSPDTNFQAVLRREHDILNFSALLTLPDARPSPRPVWPELDLLLDSVLADEVDALLGAARLYLAKVPDGREAGVSALPQLGANLRSLLPPMWQDVDWCNRGLTVGEELAVWETSRREDTRIERRIVVVAPPDEDRELSIWTWSHGGVSMPPFARYLMHVAKIRYQLRVWSGSRPVAEVCQRVAGHIAQLRTMLASTQVEEAATARVNQLVDINNHLVELQGDRARLTETITDMKAMRRTVEIAEANGSAALGTRVLSSSCHDLISDDRALVKHFVQQLDDDIAYLEGARDGAREMNEIAGNTLSWQRQRTGHAAVPTFGIVTALPEEFAAMRALMDDTNRLSVAGDRADYVVGSLPSLDADHPHQIVLTLLGETGNNYAAEACANLVRSFGTVNCVVLVGIAAGVPDVEYPDRHVRLGDIVVATWGIVDYDHVVDRPDESSLRQPFPRPSPLLVHRAKMLEAEEKTGRRPWEQWIDRARSSLPEFKRPPASADIVYAADDQDQRAAHPRLALSGHRPGRPKVHHGRIGSGDRSLRSIKMRDELNARHDLRSIEMEASGIGKAGFSNGLEWFVVRGISDYGDRRTNKMWRPYASLVAAAYTRALLAECPPIAARGGQSCAVDPPPQQV